MRRIQIYPSFVPPGGTCKSPVNVEMIISEIHLTFNGLTYSTDRQPRHSRAKQARLSYNCLHQRTYVSQV